MKRILTSIIFLGTVCFASEYYAKATPINTYNVKSSVSGKVVYVNNEIESKNATNSLIVKIDDKVNKIDLQQSQMKLKNLEEILKLEKGTLESYKKVSSKSKFDKDNQKIKILNIESSISDIKTRIETLQDSIQNKNLSEKDTYVFDIAVEIGDYVNPGTSLYTAMDLSYGKLEIFIPINDAKSITTKDIYLNGKKSDLKISKLYRVADVKHISSYKCEIIIPTPKRFSSLYKVEFK